MIQENILQSIAESAGAPEAGFFIHHYSPQDKYYVFFIDDKAEVWMVSKPYATEHHCENARQRFREGQFLADVREEEQGFFAEFKTEGGKAAGWSPVYAEEAKAEESVRQVESGGVKAEVPHSPGNETGAGETSPPRHSFRLDFYQAGPKDPVRGRIEYSLTQESTAFQGMDMAAIRAFVSQFLGKGAVAETHAMPDSGSGKLQIYQGGEPVEKSLFVTGQPLEVVPEMNLPDGVAFKVYIYARPLSGQRESLIGTRQAATGGGPLRTPVFIGSLETGLYRFTAIVHLEDGAPDGQPATRSFSSGLIQLFSETEAAVS